MENSAIKITSTSTPATTEAIASSANIFKPDVSKITLGDIDYNIFFDMNSFIELEKIYGSVDAVLKLILGLSNNTEPVVKFNGGVIRAEEITVDNELLTDLLTRQRTVTATYSDSLNFLYAGLMHDAAIYNADDEIVGYNIKKARLASNITFANIREINSKVVMAILKDLVLTPDETKNVEAPKAAE